MSVVFSVTDKSAKAPFWVICDKDNSLVMGYGDEAAANDSAAERNARAKDFGSDATYSVIPKPA